LEFDNAWVITDFNYPSEYYSNQTTTSQIATRKFWIPRQIPSNSPSFFYGTNLSPNPAVFRTNWYGMWGIGNTTNISTYDPTWITNPSFANGFKGCEWATTNNYSTISIYTTSDCYQSWYIWVHELAQNIDNYLEFCSPFRKYTGLPTGQGISPGSTVNWTLYNTVSRTCTNTTIIYGLNYSVRNNGTTQTSEYIYLQVPNGRIGTMNYFDDSVTDRRYQWENIDTVNAYCNVSNLLNLYGVTNSTPYLIDIGGTVPAGFNITYTGLDPDIPNTYNPLYKDIYSLNSYK